ncbi:hypothetical protein M406DRAFT_72836 [Cryphonectria parasitica EP155]|uniref:Uncharacterized protein n=1 Tax=Cryphonectria parasitica (strain ATCC 38755 / EP155) TaxID=660469 RepID=A0A9P4XXR7_CRYP1|nr:uncharacterized protein M406DRAFT_72836 [Cryphonectria parasitica EP155]KAF3762856.1 hypothetical protein M406DRAFT_72836 [Cryphonectria parasitica EP155]
MSSFSKNSTRSLAYRATTADLAASLASQLGKDPELLHSRSISNNAMAPQEEENASQNNPFQAEDYHGNSSALFESPAAQRETGTLQHEDPEEPANFSNNPAFKEYIRYIKTQADDAKIAAIHANLEIRKISEAVAHLETQQATIAIKQGALDTQVAWL